MVQSFIRRFLESTRPLFSGCTGTLNCRPSRAGLKPPINRTHSKRFARAARSAEHASASGLRASSAPLSANKVLPTSRRQGFSDPSAGKMPARCRQHPGVERVSNGVHPDASIPRTGSIAVKVEPLPASLATIKSPPISRQNCLLIARPSPVPPNCRAVELVAC